MELSQEQITKLRARGLDMPTIQNLAAQKGYTLPKQQDFLHKAEDVVTKFFPGQQIGKSIGRLAGYGVSKLQGTSDYYDLGTSPSVKQVLGDVAQVGATIAGAKLPVASSILGKGAQFGAITGTAAAGKAAADDKSAGEIAGAGARGGAIGFLTGATFGVVEKAVRGAGSTIGKTGQKIQQTVIKPSQRDIKDGFKIETLKKYNLGGSLTQTMSKADAKLDSLSSELNKKLGSSNASINANKVYENTVKRLFGDKFAGFGSNTQLSNAAQKLQEEINYSAGPNGLLSVPEAQIIKRAAGHYGAWQFGVPSPEAKASERVYNIFYNELKNEIEKQSPAGVRELNKQMSEIIPVMNAVIRRIPVAERNRGLSLTDIITLTGATIEPRSLVLSGLNFAQKSGRVGNALSKVTGQGVSGAIEKAEQVVQSILPRNR